MSDGTILYVCELCGGSVGAGDQPEAWDPDDDIFACDTCVAITHLALTRDQMAQVAEWVWNNIVDGVAGPCEGGNG